MILVTGATGFIGSAVTRRLMLERGNDVLAGVRGTGKEIHEGARARQTPDLEGNSDWEAALQGVDVVVHTAARVHVMRDTSDDPLLEFRRVNTAGTLTLARQAAMAGVRRFVFVSSVKVNGESTQMGIPFSADDPPAPMDAYGTSKMEAEQGLREIAAATGMAITSIRPPLVYGPGVRANLRSMMRWIRRGVPLPLGAINNRRSLIAIDNLVDLIVTCIDHSAAANQTFLASDDEDLSTTQLVLRLGRALDTPVRLFPFPSALLELGAGLMGRGDLVRRLCASLQVDITKTRTMLGWTPPVSVDEGLRRTAEGFALDSAATVADIQSTSSGRSSS